MFSRRALLCSVCLTLIPGVSQAGEPTITDGRSGSHGTRWAESVVELTVDPSLDEAAEGAFESVVLALDAWQQSAEGLPTFVVKRGRGATLGYEEGEDNQNTIFFARDGYPPAEGALAITLIAFDEEAGEILDADIVVNGDNEFTRVDPAVDGNPRFDLQGVLTHELGHFIGLAENYDNDLATMYAFSNPGETHKRDLAADDVAGALALYETSPPSDVGCGVARSSRPGAWPSAALALAIALRLRRARRLRA